MHDDSRGAAASGCIVGASRTRKLSAEDARIVAGHSY